MIVGIIPARYNSKRFPGKVLASLEGKSMVQHVYERSLQCAALSSLVVATDDQRVFDEVSAFGGSCLMTSATHRNGTERCAEVASQLPADHYVNIQGDEPLIAPSQIATVCRLLLDGAEIATLKKAIEESSELGDPNVVKVVTAPDGRALYFSRSAIPHERNSTGHIFYRHMGIYGFRADILPRLVSLPPTPLEQAESLEQLRWLENGFAIKVSETGLASYGVDTPTDLQKIQSMINERKNT